jgi:hypothetical protein
VSWLGENWVVYTSFFFFFLCPENTSIYKLQWIYIFSQRKRKPLVRVLWSSWNLTSESWSPWCYMTRRIHTYDTTSGSVIRPFDHSHCRVYPGFAIRTTATLVTRRNLYRVMQCIAWGVWGMSGQCIFLKIAIQLNYAFVQTNWNLL